MSRALAARIEEHDDRRTVIDALCATSALRSDRAASTHDRRTPRLRTYCALVTADARHDRRPAASRIKQLRLHHLRVLLCVVARQHVAAADSMPSTRLAARSACSVCPAERSPSGAAIFGVRRARRSSARAAFGTAFNASRTASARFERYRLARCRRTPRPRASSPWTCRSAHRRSSFYSRRRRCRRALAGLTFSRSFSSIDDASRRRGRGKAPSTTPRSTTARSPSPRVAARCGRC